MKRPIFFTSFFSMNWKGSKLRTSAAIWQAKAEASNPVMRSTPLLPASSAFQTASVVLPTAQIRPIPVMTRAFQCCWPNLFACLRVLADVVDGVRDGANFLRVFVGNFDIEGLFEGHHEFYGVERIRAQVIHERSAGRNLALVHTQLFHNNLFHFFINGCHCFSSFFKCFQVWGSRVRSGPAFADLQLHSA